MLNLTISDRRWAAMFSSTWVDYQTHDRIRRRIGITGISFWPMESGSCRLSSRLYWSCFVLLERDIVVFQLVYSLSYHSTKCITMGGKCGIDTWSSFVL